MCELVPGLGNQQCRVSAEGEGSSAYFFESTLHSCLASLIPRSRCSITCKSLTHKTGPGALSYFSATAQRRSKLSLQLVPSPIDILLNYELVTTMHLFTDSCCCELSSLEDAAAVSTWTFLLKNCLLKIISSTQSCHNKETVCMQPHPTPPHSVLGSQYI